MKLRDFIRHLEQHGCIFAREGAKHTVFVNPKNRKTASVPRHPTVKRGVVKGVCKVLEIPSPI